MQPQLLTLGCYLLGAALLACGGDARTTITPPAASGAGGAGAAGSPAGGGGGASPLPGDAGVDASDGGGGASGSAGGGGFYEPDSSPGGPLPVLIAPQSIVFFSPPVGSLRYAAAGYDPATRICAVIIWDYSNNELEPGLHCDDFGTYPDFPYVVVQEEVQNCDNAQGDYAGLVPEVASGCFDPLTDSVDVELEVFAIPSFYRIIMSNQ